MRTDTRPPLRCTIAIVSAAVLLGGCALQPMPAEQMDLARKALVESVATVDPGSPGLQRAQAKLAMAQRWIDAKDNGPARWLAEQAAVDAELAIARSASREAHRALAERDHAQLASARTSNWPVAMVAERSK